VSWREARLSHHEDWIIDDGVCCYKEGFLRSEARAIRAISSHSSNVSVSRASKKIGVVGAGASGMFAASAAAEALLEQGYSSNCDVVVFEGTSKAMAKVRISGGGRCNVIHDHTKPLPQILGSYPRGSKELRGLYTKHFTPDDAYRWFTSRGVELKTEADGRMFPCTDDSQTIIDAIYESAKRSGVNICMKEKVESVDYVQNCDGGAGRFQVNTKTKSGSVSVVVDALILATGSFPIGHKIAKALGHTVVQPVPSLFTFDAKDQVAEGGILNGLSGLSVPNARLSLSVAEDATELSKKRKRRKKVLSQEGPLLITHHGVSGPAALRLSAFAAREFSSVNYQCEVSINFGPQWEQEQLAKSGGNSAFDDCLWDVTRLIPKRKVAKSCPLFCKRSEDPIIPKRLWSRLVECSGISRDTNWGDVSKAKIKKLAQNLSSFSLNVTSKGVFKEEFVTAGGVDLKEVIMSKMESRHVPGLHFCGEVLDVDGVTGGFNFMGCWATGFVAGQSAAAHVVGTETSQ